MNRLQRGDQVIVTRGNHKGQKGTVVRVLTERDGVLIEGINMVKRHLKATPDRAGGIVSVEAPMHQSKVMLLDPETGKPTRVAHKIEDGKKVRVAKSGAVIQPQR